MIDIAEREATDMKPLSLLILLFIAAIAFAQNERSVLEKCQELVTLETRLHELRRRYTEGWPEVVTTRRGIERLRTELRKDSPEDACWI